VEGGACGRGSECGSGQCHALWSHFKCQCSAEATLSADCSASLEPFSLTEDAEVVLRPTEAFRRRAAFAARTNANSWSKREARQT
jgi:hypothetical protein